MKQNLLVLAVMLAATLFFTSQTWAQCDPLDLGYCDTIVVETFDCDHIYDKTGSFDSVRVAIYIVHDSNTFWWEGGNKWVQDSIRGISVPLVWWTEGCADSIVFPTYDNWNNKKLQSGHSDMVRSVFRHIEDTHTHAITKNRMLEMVEPPYEAEAWSTFIHFTADTVGISATPMAAECMSWWEGPYDPGPPESYGRVLFATLTFLVYMGPDCDTAGICLDSCFWPPNTTFSLTRYDVTGFYLPRHYLPVCDTIYIWSPPPPVCCQFPDTTCAEMSWDDCIYSGGIPTPDVPCRDDGWCSDTNDLVDVTAGEDQTGATKEDVSVMFYIQNTGPSTETYDLDVTSSLGWYIDPPESALTLGPGEIDSVWFTVSIPDVPLGTSSRVTLEATPQTYPGGGDSDSLTVTCNYYGIEIAQIADIPNDQGKQVRIEWLSFTDFDSSVTFFTIFRRIDSLLFASGASVRNLFEVSDSFALFDYPPGRWEVVATIPAFGETLYATIVPTLKDSTIVEGMYYSVFFIRAGTDNPYIYYDSPIDSGYSVDNLSPSPPTGLFASHEEVVTRLTWSPTSALDFDYYTLYRDTLSGFTPGLSNRLGFTIDTTFVDSTAELGITYYYLVSATDFSGNESNPSNEAMGVRYITGDGNGDGQIDLADAVYVINYLFIGGAPPEPLEAGDANCDGEVDLADAVYIINWLFIGGPPPPPSC